MEEKIVVKCSNCKEYATTLDIGQGFPYTCGMCGKISMEYFGNLKELTAQRNKLNRQISALKKYKMICMSCGNFYPENGYLECDICLKKNAIEKALKKATLTN